MLADAAGSVNGKSVLAFAQSWKCCGPNFHIALSQTEPLSGPTGLNGMVSMA
jgi:hypothetical protein